MNDCLTHETLLRYQANDSLTADEIRRIDDHLAACPSCRDALRQSAAAAADSLAAELLPDPNEYPCPDEASLMAYAEGRLTGTDREVVEGHLAFCARCRADVAAHAAFCREAESFDWKALPKRPWVERARDRFAQAGSRVADSINAAGRAWNRLALSARIGMGLLLGIGMGELLGPRASALQPIGVWVLNLLTSVATPLIFVAILHALVRTDLVGRRSGRLITLLLTNSLVAALIGLAVGNLIRPDRVPLRFEPHLAATAALQVPKSLLQPLVENNLLLVILFALGFGSALRVVRADQIRAGGAAYRAVEDGIETVFCCLLLVLRWVIALVPVAVLVIAADLVGRRGMAGFAPLAHLVAATLLGLTLLGGYYLARIRIGAGRAPLEFLIAVRSALLAAFSTASSAATLPVTYAVARDRLHLSEGAAGLGVLIGGSLNRDGTALFEALGVLTIAQALHIPLNWQHQAILAILAVFASICAPGVPEAGLVTMVLIFHAFGLATAANYIVLLLPLDWLLDRLRTSLNVMGHLTVACLLESDEPIVQEPPSPASETPVMPTRKD